MALYFKRVLQTGTMFGIVVLGALIWRQSTENSFVEACVFGLIALGVIGVGISEINYSAGVSPSAIVGESRSNESTRRVERRVADDLTLIVRLLQAHLGFNSSFSDSSIRANEDLAFAREARANPRGRSFADRRESRDFKPR